MLEEQAGTDRRGRLARNSGARRGARGQGRPAQPTRPPQAPPTHPRRPTCRALCSKLGHLDLNADGGAAGGGEQPAANGGAQAAGAEGEEDDTDLAHRLTEIYDRMAEIGGASAESRASKILHGLGFTEAMQVGRLGAAALLACAAARARLQQEAGSSQGSCVC